MGLCKCPKKKVTNLFCFEHRVNVCEHCLVANHPRCIVQSYLQWLQDSDYDPACRLCNSNLADEDIGDCVRLVCYDVFHWHCLDRYARQQPPNTAPAGYTCPVCSTGIFPAPNVASPVAEALRRTLMTVNWARAGLNLPLIDEPAPPSDGPGLQTSDEIKPPVTASQTSAAHQMAPSVHSGVVPSPLQSSFSLPSVQHSVVSMEDNTPYARGQEKTDFNPRKLFDSTKEDPFLNLNVSQDHDEDKYKRRPALQWFARWFNSRAGKQKKDPNATMKRFLVILVIGVIGFLTVIIIFSKLGRSSADNDPFLDPMANPNIRVEGN